MANPCLSGAPDRASCTRGVDEQDRCQQSVRPGATRTTPPQGASDGPHLAGHRHSRNGPSGFKRVGAYGRRYAWMLVPERTYTVPLATTGDPTAAPVAMLKFIWVQPGLPTLHAFLA